jgi:hypothetical protein
LITFRLAKVDTKLHIQLHLLKRRGADESEMSQTLDESPAAAGPRFTQTQGQYLAFIYAYGRIFKRPTAEADMRRHFEVTAPTVHQMVLELGVLTKQCLDRRIPDKQTLIDEIAAWQHDRNTNRTKANWQFTTRNARIKLKHLYPSF